MDRNIDIDDFPKICRLCLACGNLQPFINLKVLETFSKITSIQVSNDDKLPENVCKSCVRQLDRISKFIQTCSDNDKFLRDVINKSVQKKLSKERQSAENDIKSESSDDEKNADTRADQIFGDIKEEDEDVDQNFVTVNLNKDGPVSCQVCSQVVSSRLGLLDHYKDNPSCRPEEYTDSQNIVKYLDKSESDCKNEDDVEYDGKGPHLKGKKMFLCNFCGKNYTRKNGLDRHILSHTGVKPFECKECGKRYITKDTLKTHILTHTGIKAFKCQLCGKNFTQSSHLSYHMKRHQGERPFVCTYCGKCFVSNYHLERHKLMHTGVKPYQCKQCGKQIQYTEEGLGQCSCIESDIEPMTDIDFEDTSQESSEGSSDIQPDYESNDLEVSPHKSFEFLFEEEEPAALPYKTHCKVSECTDVEYLEDKLDVSEIKIKPDISEQTGSIGLEKTSGPTVKQELKQETGIIGTLTSGEESRKDISSGEEFKLEPKMENILRPSGYDFVQSRNVDVYFKESNQMRQEFEINDTSEHEQKFQTKKDVASEEVEDEMESRTDEFGDQTDVKMNLPDCDIGQTSLGDANEVTVHQEMKQESGIKLEDEMREYRRRGKKRRFDFSTWHGKIENKVCRRKNRFNDSTTNLTPQVCEKNMQRNDIDSAVLGAIFQKMPSDSVSLIAMTDPLICDFALEYVKGCNSEIAAMKKMRELAKLLIRVKTFEPSIKNLQDMLKPEHISVIICALKILGRFNETLNKYEKGAPVLSVGTSLKHCCKICIGKAELEDIQGFIEMLNILQKRLPRSISNDSTEGKEIHIKKESPYGECLVKTEPGMAVVNKQTVENECGTNSSGNICAVGGNELSIHHEIKQEEEIINILEKIKIESGSNTIDTNCEDDLVLLGNEINIGYRKVKNYSERPTFCFLCKKDVRHFARHLRIKHSEEPEAKEILSLPVGDKHRKALITKLRKRWNFFGNRANPRPAKILNNKVNKKILPCPNCLGFYTAKFLFRHRKMCDGAKGTRHQAWGQNLLLEHDVDPLLVETVFRRMLPDDVSFVAKNDPLICDFALKSLKTKRSGAIHISQRMRGLAKLIIHTKTFDQSVKGLRDILKPKYFDIIISSLKILAKFNDKLGKYQTGSLVLHIGTSLRNCCKIVIADKSLCSEEVQEVRDMLEILRNKWPLSYEVADKKRKKVPDANKLALEKTDKILEKQKVSNIKGKRGIKVRWTEEQKEAVKSFFAEHIKHKKSVKLSDCIDIKNRHPTLLANKDWKKIKSFVQYVCRKMSQGEETKEVSAGEKKLHARAEILRRALHATKGKVDAKKIYENMPGGTEIHEKETVSREEKGSSESEEDCDRDDVDNEKATSYEPEVVQSSNENQSSCSFYSEKRHFCVICNVEVTNLAEHLERNHSQKPELTQILSLPRGGKRKKLVLSKVKEMCIQRQSKTDYDWPANTNCPGFYSATQLVETVLQKMAPDEVTSVARNDLLIRKFALDYLKTHKLGNVSILSRKMRELAELLILSKNSEPSLSNLIDLIKPIHFHVIIDTLKTMGKYDDKLNRLGNSLLVSSVRESLTNCCEIVIKEGKRTPHEVYECIILLDILKTQWPKFVPVSDTKQVAERSKSLLPQEKETLIPWTEEQRKVVKFYFAKHIKLRKEVGEPECLDLKKLYPDLLANKNWKNIKEFVQNKCKRMPKSREVLERKDMSSPEMDKENNSIDVKYNVEDYYDIIEKSSDEELDNMMDASTKSDVHSMKELLSDEDGEGISSGLMEKLEKKDADMILENCEHIQEVGDEGQAEDNSILDEADFEIKQESDIDIVEHEIESEVSSLRRTGTRSKNFCFICKMQVNNFARHLQRRHSQEPELTQIMSLPQGSRRRKLLLTKVRKRWNFLSKEVKGLRSAKAKLVPCTNCLGYYSAKQLFRHRKKCSGGTSDRKHLASGQNLLVTNVVDPFLVETVFSRMRADDISLVAKNDPLICKFALDYLKTHKTNKHGVSAVSRKMRQLANLLMLLRSLEPSIINLRDILKPTYLDVIVRAIKFLGHFDDASGRFKKLILVVSIGWSLKYCCKMIIENEDLNPEEADVYRKMLDILRSDWPKSVSTEEKEVKMTKKHRSRTRVPWTQEQKKVVKLYFAEHIKHRKAVRISECTELKSKYPDLLANKDWRKIKVFVQNVYRKMEKEINHSEKESFSKVIHDKKKVDVGEANVPKASSGGEWDDDKRGFSPRVENSCENRMIPEIRKVYNEQDIVSSERNKENCRINVTSNGEDDYDIKEISSATAIDKKPTDADLCCEEYISDRNGFANGEEISSGVKVLENWKEEFSGKKDVDMVLESCEPIQAEVRPLYYDRAQTEYDSIFEGAEFEIMQENDIIDMVEPDIESEVTTSGRVGKRRRNFCLICKTQVHNFARHLQRRHSQEPELKQIMSLRQGSKQRKLLLTKLRKKWNFLSSEVRGQITSKAKLLPCTNCFGYYSAKQLRRHRKKCTGGTSDTKHQASGQNLLVTNVVDPLLVETVFLRMLADDVALVAKNDPLICKFALHYLKTHNNRVSIVSRKMRELAKFLILLKSLEPSVTNLKDILKPIHFDLIIRAIKILGKFNDASEKFEKGMLVVSIGGALKYCCKISIQSEELSSDEADLFKEMLNVLRFNWPKFVSTTGKGEVKMKLHSNRTRTPWTEEQKEVVKLHFTEHIKYKKSVKEGECTELKNMYPDLLANKDWKKIKVFVQNIYRSIPETEDNHNEEEPFSGMVYDNVAEANLPESSFLEGDDQIELSFTKQKSNEMKEKLTAGNDVHPSRELSSRLEEVNSRVEEIVRGDDHERKKMSCRTEESLEEEVDKEVPTNTKGSFSRVTHDDVAEANLPESSCLEGDDQIELSLPKEKSNEMKEKLTAGNDVHPSRELSSRLEEVNSRVEAILRGDDHERKAISCSTEESLEEEVDNSKDVPTNTDISPAEQINNTKKVWNCMNKKKRRLLIPWTDEQKQVVKAFFADHIKRKQAVKEYECSNLKSQYPDLLANKDWKKIKVYVQNLYTNKTK